MSHKLLHARFESVVSPDGHSVEIKAWGGTMADGLEALKEDKRMEERYVLLQPKMDMPENKMMSYKKYMVECAVNLLQDMCENMTPNLFYGKDGEQGVQGLTVHGVHEDQLSQLRALSATLCYMINSQSWATGTAEVFDIRTVQHKLKALIPSSMLEV